MHWLSGSTSSFSLSTTVRATLHCQFRRRMSPERPSTAVCFFCVCLAAVFVIGRLLIFLGVLFMVSSVAIYGVVAYLHMAPPAMISPPK